jgi:hypothetical protein
MDPLYVHNLTYVYGTSTRGPQYVIKRSIKVVKNINIHCDWSRIQNIKCKKNVQIQGEYPLMMVWAVLQSLAC